MSELELRALSSQERERAFASGASASALNLAPYLETVREMEGGVAYALSTNGTTTRALKVRLNRAAKQLNLRLRWAKYPKGAKEIVVELSE